MSRIVEFFRKPIPREVVKNVHKISYNKFKLLGFDTFIFDYDNTLAPFGRHVSADVIKLFETLIEKGFKVAVVTNGSLGRTKNLRDRVQNVLVFAKARKPGLKTLKLAVWKLKTKPSKVVLVGDLFFTDIIAGNRLGMYTVLVAPYPGVGFFLKTVAFFEKISYSAVFYTFGWLFRISELVSPNEWHDNVFDIDYEKLISSGVKLFTFDMDNTLAKWRAPNLDKRSLELLRELSKRSRVAIFSNGNSLSLDWISKNVDIIVVKRAHKPLTSKFVKILKRYKFLESEVVVIGDQLFTDVLMANLSGAYSIKVNPISKDEIFFTKFLRILEKIVKPLIKPKPSIKAKNEDVKGKIKS